MLLEDIKKVILDENLFFINGIKKFINDFENKTIDIYSDKNVYIKSIYDNKRRNLKFIRKKKEEYRRNIIVLDDKIKTLINSLKELQLEKDTREKNSIKDKNFNNLDKEKLDDIKEVIKENKRIINIEKNRLRKLKIEFEDFNNSSKQEERSVYILFDYIKNEYLNLRDDIIKSLSSKDIKSIELIITYEALSIISKKILCIEEDLLGE